MDDEKMMTEQDKINGLQYGGDDYITKPRVLCEKHGGNLQFMNAVPNGGIVKINIRLS